MASDSDSELDNICHHCREYFSDVKNKQMSPLCDTCQSAGVTTATHRFCQTCEKVRHEIASCVSHNEYRSLQLLSDFPSATAKSCNLCAGVRKAQKEDLERCVTCRDEDNFYHPGQYVSSSSTSDLCVRHDAEKKQEVDAVVAETKKLSIGGGEDNADAKKNADLAIGGHSGGGWVFNGKSSGPKFSPHIAAKNVEEATDSERYLPLQQGLSAYLPQLKGVCPGCCKPDTLTGLKPVHLKVTNRPYDGAEGGQDEGKEPSFDREEEWHCTACGCYVAREAVLGGGNIPYYDGY